MKIAAKFRIALFLLLRMSSVQSCKKCYVCACTNISTAFGCSPQGEEIETRFVPVRLLIELFLELIT